IQGSTSANERAFRPDMFGGLQPKPKEINRRQPKTAGAGAAEPSPEALVAQNAQMQTAERNSAGLRSLPVEITARGKRLILSGPAVSSEPLSVTLRVK
ncbi:MAG TPA: hypothetical protein VKF32_16180, partial [Thermoanaerobaculia bacterium]|nr:hypothetical protein [Thermoanaerobaculia bacterium]